LRAVSNVTKQSSSVEPLLDSLEVDSGKIAHVLGWRPPYTMMRGLGETAKWFTSET
jgi:nucleoside-diphosphate-sugar epimerase